MKLWKITLSENFSGNEFYFEGENIQEIAEKASGKFSGKTITKIELISLQGVIRG